MRRDIWGKAFQEEGTANAKALKWNVCNSFWEKTVAEVDKNSSLRALQASVKRVLLVEWKAWEWYDLESSGFFFKLIN